MRLFKSIGFVLLAYYILLLHESCPQFVVCSSIEDAISHSPSTHKNNEAMQQYKMSHQMTYSMKLHGILLWASMGFLMPLGILSIRMANKFHESGRKTKVFFYLHAITQIMAVLLATAGAIMSLRTLENSFNNSHQRLGLALYAAMWLQFLTGALKPSRGSKRRMKWYIMHWTLGTIVSLVGVINIYTGIRAYEHKTSSRHDSHLWTLLFTAQISCLALFYLFQDKWDVLFDQKKRANVDDHQDTDTANPNVNGGSDHRIIQVVSRNEPALILVPNQASAKSNALMNLFE